LGDGNVGLSLLTLDLDVDGGSFAQDLDLRLRCQQGGIGLW
jgi:hypothetical protein